MLKLGTTIGPSGCRRGAGTLLSCPHDPEITQYRQRMRIFMEEGNDDDEWTLGSLSHANMCIVDAVETRNFTRMA